MPRRIARLIGLPLVLVLSAFLFSISLTPIGIGFCIPSAFAQAIFQKKCASPFAPITGIGWQVANNNGQLIQWGCVSPVGNIVLGNIAYIASSNSDDTTEIQRIIDSKGTTGVTRILLTDSATYNVTSLTINNITGLTISSAGARSALPGNMQPVLNFTGSCSVSACLQIRSSSAITFSNIQLNFPNATSGPMIDLSPLTSDSQLLSFHGVAFKGPGPAIGPLILDESTDFVLFDDWSIFQSASVFVSGPRTNGSSTGFSDNTHFENVIFLVPGTASIQNASVSWTFENSDFQQTGASTCLPILQYVGGFTNQQSTTFDGNTILTSQGINCNNVVNYISFPDVSANLGGVEFRGNLIASGFLNPNATLVSLGNGQAFSASGNSLANIQNAWVFVGNNSAFIGPNIYSNVTVPTSGAIIGGQILEGGRTTITNFQPGAAKTFATLGAPANGILQYCSDCNATCTAGAGTGRMCARENGLWVGF